MQWLQETFTALTTAETSTSGQETDTGSKGDPKHLQIEGQLSKEQLLKFFEEASKQLRSEGYRRKLKDAFLLKQDIEDMINAMQMEIFERQGVQGQHGIRFLGEVGSLYKSDNDVMAELLKFVTLEEDAMDEAELPQAEYEQKRRLHDLAKAHTAQLMAKMDELPPEERQKFLQTQLKVAEQLKMDMAAGGTSGGVAPAQPPPTRPAKEQVGSMTREEQLKFFQAQQS